MQAPPLQLRYRMTSFVFLAVLSAVHVCTAGSSLETREVIPGVGQYILITQQLNWTDAYVACQSSRGSLAVINSIQEANALKVLLTKYGMSSTHLGFHDMISEGVYTTIDGRAIEETDLIWATGAPKGSFSLNCGALTTNGIKDEDCAVKSQTICELSLSDDYDLITGLGYYRYHPEKRTWSQAWEICQSEGTRLLIVNSEAEASAIQGKYPVDGPVWVGVHRLFGAKQFVTVNNEPLASTGYTKWYSSFPEANATLYPSVGFYRAAQPVVGLGTFIGSSQYTFICERDLHP